MKKDRRDLSIKAKDNTIFFFNSQEEKILTGASTLFSRKNVEYKVLKQTNQ